MDAEKVMHHLRSIHVERLFGRYTYNLPARGETLRDINIIYGQNGAGKTSLLHLVFHLLSPAETLGHKSRISDVPFAYLEVSLVDGTKISARKDQQLLVGPVEFAISRPDQHDVSWKFTPGPRPQSIRAEDLPSHIDIARLPLEMRQEVERAIEQRTFFDQLKQIQMTIYMLTSDRILLGDSVRETSRADLRPEPTRSRKLADIVLEHRIASVTDALSGASSWLRSKFLEKSYGSNESAGNLYLEVIRKIAKTTYRTKAGLNKAQEGKLISSLEQSISEIERRSKLYAQFGLAVPSISQDILPAIQGSHGNRLHLIHNVLEPHLGSIKARLDSIEPLYSLISDFTGHINKFFTDKKLIYGVRTGLRIAVEPNSDGPSTIDAAQLSSGEQQLMLLFCHVLIARDTPSVFIIDEPEISLNIAWQRMLVSSLQDIGKGSNVQLVFASHSMEILAKHRSRVVSMQEE